MLLWWWEASAFVLHAAFSWNNHHHIISCCRAHLGTIYWKCLCNKYIGYIRIACVRAFASFYAFTTQFSNGGQMENDEDFWMLQLGWLNRRNRKFGQIHIHAYIKISKTQCLIHSEKRKWRLNFREKFFSLSFCYPFSLLDCSFFSFLVYTESVCARILQIAMLRIVKDCWEFLCVRVYRWLIKFYGGTS